MALGDAYASATTIKSYMRITDTTEDALITTAAGVASRTIEKICGRQFNKATSATARVFAPQYQNLAVIDDFHTTSGLIVAVDYGDDGTYDTTLTSADYTLEPINGVVDGELGWPFWRIRLVNTVFPSSSAHGSLQVTAQWGWTAVPDPITLSCVYLAEEAYKLKGAPFGVANTDQFGPIRVRNNPKIMSWLAPYQRDMTLVA